jgi:hypothetical protein
LPTTPPWPADHHRGTENAAAAARTDGKRGGQHLAQGQGEQKGHRQFVVDGLLGVPVAERQGVGQEKADDAGQQAADGRFDVVGDFFEGPEDSDGPVKGLDIEDTRWPPGPAPAPDKAQVQAGFEI